MGGTDAGSPDCTNEGTGYIRNIDELVGDWDNRIGLNNPATHDIADQHVTDEGSVNLTFTDPVDLVTLTITNVAANQIDAALFENFNDGSTANQALQTWAFSVGDVSFTTIPEPSSVALLGLGLLLGLRRQRRD